VNTTATGHKAEQAARTYLEMRGFEILEQNWRLPRHEIDIVARKDGVIHFVEVKYRATDEQGGGFEAITRSKILKMRSAAWAWVDDHKYRGEYTLSAVELAGPNFAVISFVEDAF
jgi:putative endonuclease